LALLNKSILQAEDYSCKIDLFNKAY